MRGVRIPYRSFADAGLRFGTEAKNRKASYECLRTVVRATLLSPDLSVTLTLTS